MEEIKSTEVLDREILEDARKKAQKILKTADDTLLAQKKEWEKKGQESIESLRKTYSERLEKNTNEKFARLPLDKKRMRSKNAEGILIKAMEGFLCALKRETLLSVLERELLECFEDFTSGGENTNREKTSGGENNKESFGDAPLIRYSGMELSEAARVIEDALNRYSFTPKDITKKADSSGSLFGREFPSIVIDLPSVRITASVESAAAALLSEKRAELSAALLGPEVLDD